VSARARRLYSCTSVCVCVPLDAVTPVTLRRTRRQMNERMKDLDKQGRTPHEDHSNTRNCKLSWITGVGVGTHTTWITGVGVGTHTRGEYVPV